MIRFVIEVDDDLDESTLGCIERDAKAMLGAALRELRNFDWSLSGLRHKSYSHDLYPKVHVTIEHQPKPRPTT